jgi:hypothetical protein
MLVHIAIVLSFLPVSTPDPLGARLASATVVRGAPGAVVHYTASCSPAAGNFYTLRVTLAQRTGHTITTGHAEVSSACTGRRQPLVLQTRPDRPFRAGRVSVTACMRVRNTRPLPPAYPGPDDPLCTTPPRTVVVDAA